jgi:FkbM family methyltransferase
MSKLIHKARLKLSKNRLGRALHSNYWHELFFPYGCEPAVTRCLHDYVGHESFWDVGAFVGRYAWRFAYQFKKVFAFEPNLNNLQFLGANTDMFTNVVIVPLALTLTGKPIRGTHDPDFNHNPTGPDVATISVAEAFAKFGPPSIVKMDVEGAEYGLLADPLFRSVPVLVEWHESTNKIDKHWWAEKVLDATHSLLTPK